MSCLGRILERIILSDLKTEMVEKRLLPQYQAGFRAGHSCTDAAACLRDIIIHARSRKEDTVVCLLDISKAFESVWIDGLCWKLCHFGINSSTCGIIKSFLSNRDAFVEIQGERSDSFPVEREGCPRERCLARTDTIFMWQISLGRP